MSFKERFEKFIVKTESCWLWEGARQGIYGAFWLNGKLVGSHKASYLLYKGNIADGYVVRHMCKDKLCVNPEHLEIGTRKQNSMDRFRDNTINNKLTPEQVIMIRDSTDSAKVLAERFKVTSATIRCVVNRKTWQHL